MKNFHFKSITFSFILLSSLFFLGCGTSSQSKGTQVKPYQRKDAHALTTSQTETPSFENSKSSGFIVGGNTEDAFQSLLKQTFFLPYEIHDLGTIAQNPIQSQDQTGIRIQGRICSRSTTFSDSEKLVIEFWDSTALNTGTLYTLSFQLISKTFRDQPQNGSTIDLTFSDGIQRLHLSGNSDDKTFFGYVWFRKDQKTEEKTATENSQIYYLGKFFLDTKETFSCEK